MSIRKRLTQQYVDRLTYDPRKAQGSGRMEVLDDMPRGLELRVTPEGRASYSVRFRVRGEGGVSSTGRLLAGRPYRITLGSAQTLELSKARDEATEILTKAAEGVNMHRQRREENLLHHGNTFISVRRRFIDTVMKPKVKNWKTVESTLRLHVEPAWESRPVASITRKDVHQLFDDLVADGKAKVAREVRTHLSRYFGYCTNRDLIDKNPMLGLERDDLRKGDDEEAGRELTDDELRSIWKAAGSMGAPFGTLYQLLILTGQRRNEWADAKRSEIDAHKRWLEVPKARYKGKRDHIVPMSDAVWALFETLPAWAGNDYFILTTTAGERPVSGFSRAKARLDKAAGKLPYFRIHDFRVTCETRLASLGFNQEVRDAVLGHAKPGLQKTYNKFGYQAEKRAALDAYAEHIMKIVGGK
jgi:integrase